MKAARLLNLVLLLQTRHRITTTELAQRLEVSRRTVLRDVDALSTAGVPVYAERGRHGGIVLLPGARLNASHLEPGELEALAIAGLDGEQLDRLGLAAVHESATRKIAARQATSSSSSSSSTWSSHVSGRKRLADVVLVENSAWMRGSTPSVDVADLASALREDRRLTIRYRRSSEARSTTRVVDPYGLVSKSGRWYLVADHEGGPRLFALDRLEDYDLLDGPATLRSEQTLHTVWSELSARTETPGRVHVTLRLRTSRLDLAQRILGNRIHEVSDVGSEWCTVVVRYPDIESVRQLLQFGDHLEVVSPPAARDRIRQLAEDLAQRHSTDVTHAE